MSKTILKLFGLSMVVLAAGFVPLRASSPQDGRSDLHAVAIVSALEMPAEGQYEALAPIPITPQQYVQAAAARYGWAGGEWEALHTLITNESNFRPHAANPSSSAYGMFQFLDSTWASYGCTKTADVAKQAECGMRYIKARYGTPSNALRSWRSRCGSAQGCWY